jgi:hypothetical protein
MFEIADSIPRMPVSVVSSSNLTDSSDSDDDWDAGTTAVEHSSSFDTTASDDTYLSRGRLSVTESFSFDADEPSSPSVLPEQMPTLVNDGEIEPDHSDANVLKEVLSRILTLEKK